MNQDNRNEQNCQECSEKNFGYFAKRFSKEFSLALCKQCYEYLNEQKKNEYISKEAFRKYQEEELKKAQPFFYQICKQNDKNFNYHLIQTTDNYPLIENYKEKFDQIIQRLIDVEQGNQDSIFKLFGFIHEFQEYYDRNLLIAFQFGRSLNVLEKVDINKFKYQLEDYFQNDINYYIRVQLYKLLQNELVKQISDRIQNCIDFPIFLSIVGDSFNNPLEDGFEKQNYYGYLDKQKQKTGLGIWNKNNQLYYGIFYQDIFLWGIRAIIDSNCQYSLYQGFFSRPSEQDKDNFLINGYGEMFSKDEDGIYHEYVGQFLNQKRQGEGTYSWKFLGNKKAQYKGFWQNDLYHGQGTLELLEQNIILQGEFSFGVPIRCQIQGKDIKKQDLCEYLAKLEKEAIENTKKQLPQIGVPQTGQPFNFTQFRVNFNQNPTSFNNPQQPFIQANNQPQFPKQFPNQFQIQPKIQNFDYGNVKK